MRITIVNGFFLPVPPVSGGSTEKTWHRLGREFAARGHQVTSISRRWRDFPEAETVDGIRHVRLRGHDHQRSRVRNLLLDFLWSWRVYRALPEADIVVCNAVTLPLWLGRFKPRAGKVVTMCGRMPKGQYRRYSRVARVYAPSEPVRDGVLRENPGLGPLVRTVGYPIDWTILGAGSESASPFAWSAGGDPALTIGFVGRLHEEKGLLLLAEALAALRATPGLPPWELVLCGPSEVARGGSGPDFRMRLLGLLSRSVDPARLHILEPRFDDRQLAAVYRNLDVFCYPSLAEQGETFGVAVAEAMAAGAVPVVSSLACFRDLVRSDRNGLVFDHRGAGAARGLASALARLLGDAGLRRRLATAARADTQPYDYPRFAERLLADFATLARG